MRAIAARVYTKKKKGKKNPLLGNLLFSLQYVHIQREKKIWKGTDSDHDTIASGLVYSIVLCVMPSKKEMRKLCTVNKDKSLFRLNNNAG